MGLNSSKNDCGISQQILLLITKSNIIQRKAKTTHINQAVCEPQKNIHALINKTLGAQNDKSNLVWFSTSLVHILKLVGDLSPVNP